MKKYNSYILLVLFVVVSTSCSEDFIELTPVSEPSVNILYQTDQDFEGALIGVYDGFQPIYDNYWQFSELRSDNADHRWTGFENIQRMDQFRLELNEGILNDIWEDYYQVISRANTVLDNLPDDANDVITRPDFFEAESKFLRGLAYFDMVRIWGEIPLVVELVSADEALETPQSTVEAIYGQIIEDLTFAAENLPSPQEAEIGRASRGAALALLGKVQLTRGDFASAEPVLAEVMTLGYELLNDFEAVFDYDNEHHAEYIFDIEYQENLGGEGSNFTSQFIPNSSEVQDLYGIVGTPGETFSPTDEFIALFDDADTRSFLTWTPVEFDPGDGSIITVNHTFTKKYVTSQIADNDSRANWKVIRFADVVLMYAEALNENNKTDQALAELNKIRQRAGVSQYSALSQTEARDAIALERRLELAFEGHRWFDLVRTNRAVQEMQPKGYDIQDFHVLYPKPQQQIDIVNDENILNQNNGY